MKQIVLASTSPFRKEILNKLNIAFECAKPNIDESGLDNEDTFSQVERLAIEKAKAVAGEFPNALIIGSDQLALFEGKALGKPGSHENAMKQLASFSGKKVTFYTGLCVYNSETQEVSSLVEPFEVHFKTLSTSDIEQYLFAEQPYNCAGSFKSEALGICLFEKLVGDDPNTLVGLPLIKLVELLANHGFNVLSAQKKP